MKPIFYRSITCLIPALCNRFFENLASKFDYTAGKGFKGGLYMRFALVNNKRSEAGPRLKGICPGCKQPVIPKCGAQKIHHWAHKSSNSCDSWWESETEWHRAWKNHFPNDWQEVFLPDEETGEKRIADIYTKDGLVIEFQHSKIKREERISREKFYKNMIWVVDGTNSRNDFAYNRFLKGIDKEHYAPFTSVPEMRGFYYCMFPDLFFPKSWLESSVPVVFDFLGLKEVAELNDPIRMTLYYLYPQPGEMGALFAAIPRSKFTELTTSGKLLGVMNKRLNHFKLKESERKKQREEESKRQQEKFRQQQEELEKQEILNKKLRGKYSKKPRLSSIYSSYVPPWEEEYYLGEEALKERQYSEATDFFKHALELNSYPENKTYIKSAIAKACKMSGN